MAELVSTGIASAGGSIVAYSLLSWYRRRKDKTKRMGCVLPLGKSYAELNLVENEDLVFIDLDGAISVRPVRDIDKAKLRLELYPKAKEHYDKICSQFKNKRICFCSSSYELLRHVGIKAKRVHSILPSKKFITDSKGKLEGVDIEKLDIERLKTELEVPKNTKHFFNSLDELTRKLQHIYKHML